MKKPRCPGCRRVARIVALLCDLCWERVPAWEKTMFCELMQRYRGRDKFKIAKRWHDNLVAAVRFRRQVERAQLLDLVNNRIPF